MRSALYIGSKQNNPLTRTQIPSCASPNGMPFCFEYSGEVTQWQLVKDGEEYGYDLDVSWLTNDGKYIYYNGDVDLLEYLTGLGYDARAGRYYYSFRLDGVGDNVIEGVSPFSRAYFAQPSAYGTWEYGVDFSKLNIQYSIISDLNNNFGNSGMNIIPDIRTGWVGLNKRVSGATAGDVIQSEFYYLTEGGVYIFKVSRNQTENQYHTGEADSYLIQAKGSDLGNTFIDVPAAAGFSNPATDTSFSTSLFSLLAMDSGAKIYNIKKDGVLIPLEDIETYSGSVLKYKTYSGGTIKQSNLFQLECEDTRPITPGDFNNDFSNDFF